jgi:hypothetical protein
MLKAPRALALLIHVAAYAVVVAICAGVNLWLAPDNLWFVWVALGWGIGVAAHALAFWLRHTRRRERVFIDCKARGFTVHLFAYVATTVILFVVNLLATPKVWWFYWVALGWGAGVVLHGWCVFFRKRAPGEAGQRGRRRFGRRREPLIELPEEPTSVPEPKPAPQPAKKTPPAKKRATPRKKPAAPRKSPKPKT